MALSAVPTDVSVHLDRFNCRLGAPLAEAQRHFV
jgi:hypothetical protein